MCLEEVTMKKLLKKFILDEQGLETVEYAVMTALIVAAMITAIVALSATITARFDAVETVIAEIG